MDTNLITRLGDVAAKAASCAIHIRDRAGVAVVHILAPLPGVV